MASSLFDPDLKRLLSNWSLQHHYDHFLQQKITVKVLKILRPIHIEKLFSDLPVGDQAIFEHCLDLWKKSIQYENDDFICKKTSDKSLKTDDEVTPAKRLKMSSDIRNDQTGNVHNVIETLAWVDSEDSNVNENTLKAMSKTSISTPRVVAAKPRPVASAVTPIVSRHIHKPTAVKTTNVIAATKEPTPNLLTQFRQTQPTRYDLMKILTETSGGQLILNYYSKHQLLREEHRTALINVIARYIDANGCHLTLSQSTHLEQQIVEIFPTEKEEFYRTQRRGRIYNKIANMKRIYNKFSKQTEEPVVNTQAASPASSSISIKEEDEYVDVYTENNIDDWRAIAQNTGNFQEFWLRSQSLRLNQINEIETLQEILLCWPEYKESNISELVSLDFIAKFNQATKLSKVFYENFTKLEKLIFTKVNSTSMVFKYLQLYKQCSLESQYLLIFYALHQLFPPKHHMVIENGIKCKKRYSIQDSQNSCIYIQKSQTLIDQFLNTKTTATPPMIFVIGELGGDIEEISIYFEGICYPMTSIVTAVELCCELYFLFNIDYPEESVMFYHFMQIFFLNIHPEVKNSKIYTTINDINAY